MEHTDITISILTFHCSCLLAAIGAFYRVGDRSSIVLAARDHARGCLGRLKLRLRARLTSLLLPVFENTDVITISEILNLDGEPLVQQQVNPIGSENYRNAVDTFVDDKFDAVIDFRVIKNSLSVWEGAVRLRCWTILILLCWQLIVIVLIAFPEKIMGWQVYPELLVASAVPTCFGLFLFLSTTVLATYHYDRILEVARDHE